MGECEGMREKCLTLDLCMLIDKGKNHQVEDLVSLDGRSRGGSYLLSKPARKLEKNV